jgi:hypothetical protein
MRREHTDQEMASGGRECLPTRQYAELTVPNLPCAGKTTALHRSPQIDNPPDSGQTVFLLFVSPGAGLTYKYDRRRSKVLPEKEFSESADFLFPQPESFFLDSQALFPYSPCLKKDFRPHALQPA